MAASCTVECAARNWRTFNDNADVVSPIQCILLVTLSTSIDSYDPDKVSTDSLLTVAAVAAYGNLAESLITHSPMQMFLWRNVCFFE